MPGLPLPGKHKKHKKRHERDLEKERVKRTDTAKDQVADNSAIARRFTLRRQLASRHGSRSGHTAFNAADFLFNGCRSLPPRSAVLRPVLSEIRYASPKTVPNRADHRAEQENHDHGTDGAGDAPPLQILDDGIETVCEENREHQSDHHALRVVREKQNDRCGDNPQAEGRAYQASIFFYRRCFGRGQAELRHFPDLQGTIRSKRGVCGVAQCSSSQMAAFRPSGTNGSLC